MWMPTITNYIVTQRNKPNRGKKMFLICKAILYSWLILLTFRLYISAFILTYGKDRFHWFLPFDPIMNYAFLTFPFFDPYILLAGSFTPLYCLAVDYAIYFKADERSIGFFHDFIYKNGDQFWQLNSTLFNSSSDSFVLTVSRTIASCKLIWRGKIAETRLRFKHQHFRYMPKVSKQLRAKAVLLTLLLSCNIVFSCILFCKCCLTCPVGVHDVDADQLPKKQTQVQLNSTTILTKKEIFSPLSQFSSTFMPHFTST